MRGCLFVVIVAALVLGAAAWFGAPPLAETLIRGAITGSGVASGPVAVEVSASPPLELLTGRADAVRVRASGVRLDRLAAEAMDVRFARVDLIGRSYATIDGTLSGVAIPTGGGGAISASRIELSGPAGTVLATVHVSRDLAAASLADATARAIGRPVASVALDAPDRVTFSLGPVGASARLLAVDGGLVLEVDVPGRPRVVVLAAGDPLAVRSVDIGDDLVVTGTIDGSGWLSG